MGFQRSEMDKERLEFIKEQVLLLQEFNIECFEKQTNRVNHLFGALLVSASTLMGFAASRWGDKPDDFALATLGMSIYLYIVASYLAIRGIKTYELGGKGNDPATLMDEEWKVYTTNQLAQLELERKQNDIEAQNKAIRNRAGAVNASIILALTSPVFFVVCWVWLKFP